MKVTCNQNPKVRWSGLPPESSGFFRGPHATFPLNFVKIGWVALHNPANGQTNKQTNAGENIISLASASTNRFSTNYTQVVANQKDEWKNISSLKAENVNK